MAGAATLGLITAPRWREMRRLPDWKAVAALSCYMACFSFADVTLPTGTGALLLFGAVQLTMITSAIRSGALASGLGYVIWYAALPRVQQSQAATVQLSVPFIAAIGGAMFLSEEVSIRLVVTSILTLGGIWLVLGSVRRGRMTNRPPRGRFKDQGALRCRLTGSDRFLRRRFSISTATENAIAK